MLPSTDLLDIVKGTNVLIRILDFLCTIFIHKFLKSLRNNQTVKPAMLIISVCCIGTKFINAPHVSVLGRFILAHADMYLSVRV